MDKHQMTLPLFKHYFRPRDLRSFLVNSKMLTVALPWEWEFLNADTMHIYSPGKMVSLDGNLNLSATWFEELFTCSRDELEVGDDKELTEEARTSIWKDSVDHVLHDL